MMSGLYEGGKQSKVKKEFLSVNHGLKFLYRDRLLPLEKLYKFHDFFSSEIQNSSFDAKPMILLIGEYSTGKSTFIRYLLEQDFPGMRIGPEPTTDKFIAIMHGEKENVIPGNVLVADLNKPFNQLSEFGNAFLNRFQCSMMKNPVLENISIIDSPGILSGEKQHIDRGYDFTEVVRWFAERVDRIILLFDAHKIDISDELKQAVMATRNYEDKIRIVLNKADLVDHQQLMRVYGALMWSLGRVISTPEVSRVYISTFWDRPLHNDYFRKLFELEARDLFNDIVTLPRNSMIRKLNDLVKRARQVKVHAYLISYLGENMPSYFWFGGTAKKTEMIEDLDNIFTLLQERHSLPRGDFPNVIQMQQQLAEQDFYTFPALDPELLKSVDRMLSEDVASLMKRIPAEEEQRSDVPSGSCGLFRKFHESPSTSKGQTVTTTSKELYDDKNADPEKNCGIILKKLKQESTSSESSGDPPRKVSGSPSKSKGQTVTTTSKELYDDKNADPEKNSGIILEKLKQESTSSESSGDLPRKVSGSPSTSKGQTVTTTSREFYDAKDADPESDGRIILKEPAHESTNSEPSDNGDLLREVPKRPSASRGQTGNDWEAYDLWEVDPDVVDKIFEELESESTNSEPRPKRPKLEVRSPMPPSREKSRAQNEDCKIA